MEILVAIFGLFAVGSLAALVKFQGNPLFLFSFLLSTASASWIAWSLREEKRRLPARAKRARQKGR